MTTVILNNNNNAYPGLRVDLECAGYSLRGVRKMHLKNFKTDQERFWVIVQFFDKYRNSLDYVSIDRSTELTLHVKQEYSSYVVILNTNDGEREVSFDLDLVAKN
jgi:hypothetical protein